MDEILPNLGLELPDVGSDQDTWGDILNENLRILDNAVTYDAITKTLGAVDVTLTTAEAAHGVINLNGTLTANVNLIVPVSPVRLYLVNNGTTGAFTVTVKTPLGTGITVLQGANSLVYSNGTNIVQGATSVNGSFSAGNTSVANLAYTGTLTGGTGVINIGSGQIYKDGSGNVGINNTAGGNRVRIRSADNLGGTRIVRVESNNAAQAVEIGFGGVYSSGGALALSAAAGNPVTIETDAGGGAAERFRIDTAGNAGLGVTPSAWATNSRALQLSSFAAVSGNLTSGNMELTNNAYQSDNAGNFAYVLTQAATRYAQALGNHFWFTAPSGTAGNPITFTQAMTLTQGGNLLVGTTTDVLGQVQAVSTNAVFRATSSSATGALYTFVGPTNSGQITNPSGSIKISTNGATNLIVETNGTERNRTTSGGYFKASNTGAYTTSEGVDVSNGEFHHFQTNTSTINVYASNTNIGAGFVNFRSDLALGSAGFHMQGYVNASVVYQVLANGNVQNTNNSYGPISDAKLKENIADAPSFLDRFMQLRFVTYNLKESLGYNPEKQLGWIAQEVEQIFPSLVYDNIDTEQVTKTRIVEVPAVLDEEGNEVTPATTREEEYTESVPTGTVTKALKASIISVIQGKVIQEQQAIINAQQAQIDSILGRLLALESK